MNGRFLRVWKLRIWRVSALRMAIANPIVNWEFFEVKRPWWMQNEKHTNIQELILMKMSSFSLHGAGSSAKTLPPKTIHTRLICRSRFGSLEACDPTDHLSRNFGHRRLRWLSVTWRWQYSGKFATTHPRDQWYGRPPSHCDPNNDSWLIGIFFVCPNLDQTVFCVILEWCWPSLSSTERTENSHQHCRHNYLTSKYIQLRHAICLVRCFFFVSPRRLCR